MVVSALGVVYFLLGNVWSQDNSDYLRFMLSLPILRVFSIFSSMRKCVYCLLCSAHVILTRCCAAVLLSVLLCCAAVLLPLACDCGRVVCPRQCIDCARHLVRRLTFTLFASLSTLFPIVVLVALVFMGYAMVGTHFFYKAFDRLPSKAVCGS